MRLNLNPLIEKDTQQIIHVFTQLGWNQEDCAYLSQEIPYDPEILTNIEISKFFPNQNLIGFYLGLTIYPQLLSYDYALREGFSGDKVGSISTIEVWQACRVSGWELESRETIPSPILNHLIKDQIFEPLKTVIKPFKDEDAIYGYFQESRFDSTQELVFFLNPDYPNGWWENHTL
jgi:hypothetical protein